MNKFNDREKGFEKKFQIDQELQFKVQARSNKYLSDFVCLKLGKTPEQKEIYIKEIIKADMEEAGQEDVFRKIKKDLELGSVNLEEAEIRNEMEKALLRAKEDFK